MGALDEGMWLRRPEKVVLHGLRGTGREISCGSAWLELPKPRRAKDPDCHAGATLEKRKGTRRKGERWEIEKKEKGKRRKAGERWKP